MALDFPSNPVNGQVYGNFYWDSSMSAWRATGTSIPAVPAGVVSQFMGTTAPSGYLMCQGQSVLAADYPALFAVVGYTYGGSGINFAIPNMQGRVTVGAGSITDVNANSQTFTLGTTSGELSHKLTVAELASHTHTQNAHNHTQDAHGHAWTGQNSSLNNNGQAGNYPFKIAQDLQTQWTGTTGNISTTIATNQATTAVNQNAGGDGYHNNLQPYIVVNYIIKT